MVTLSSARAHQEKIQTESMWIEVPRIRLDTRALETSAEIQDRGATPKKKDRVPGTVLATYGTKKNRIIAGMAMGV